MATNGGGERERERERERGWPAIREKWLGFYFDCSCVRERERGWWPGADCG